ncbi:MAG: AAA family ATPase [Gammaproteobacteria bacterium]|nr:AAA family ATPase [Gammaproteobacteria bacterium]NIM72627.1 AAA family ATPase [Gammaproteobacteria bacterium]NIN37684.1 AAA family ATPase [Gammaproteobacteria bacterium]NIO24388.1 AAA family ATPase [Gammaproteobacteria bacterium]NIO64991.1 AAA family ATPase [Gammaproteobacteria bacterium]
MTSRGRNDRAVGESLPPLIAALRDAGCYDHPTDAIVVLETHISYVLLTGRFAYKIKKALTLPFLDFSTLDFRKHYCDEELRINRRLASELYVDVVPITGTPAAPRMNGDGRPIEYAVKMVQFPDADRLDRVAERGELDVVHIKALADKIAAFHDEVAVADRGSPFADSEHLRREMMENFESLSAQSLPADTASLLEDIRAWTAHSLVDLGRLFRLRKQQGMVRECHGDMHLANMALLEGRVTIFDALEFNENFRWIDVQSELAFLAMDLDYRGLANYAWLLLSGYLDASGDYAGLRLLRHYKVYRAMVRAKVAALRAGQCRAGTAEHEQCMTELREHVALAHAYLKPAPATPLIITHGLSGSGKSWLSEQLLQLVGAVRIRSDVERQRLVRTGELREGALYSPAAIRRTYESLERLARTILGCGYPVIVDATFLKHDHRLLFVSLAKQLGARLVILSLHAAESVLEARVARRLSEAADASEATLEVLRGQRASLEALDDEEREAAIEVPGDDTPDLEALARRCLRGRAGAPVMRRLEAGLDDGH